MIPTFSSDIWATPAHSPPANVTRDSEPFFQPPNRPVDTSQHTCPDSSAAMQTSAGKLPLDSSFQHLSTLAQTLLLHSNNQPVSLNQININSSLLHHGALVQTPLLTSTSRLASLTPTIHCIYSELQQASY